MAACNERLAVVSRPLPTYMTYHTSQTPHSVIVGSDDYAESMYVLVACQHVFGTVEQSFFSPPQEKVKTFLAQIFGFRHYSSAYNKDGQNQQMLIQGIIK